MDDKHILFSKNNPLVQMREKFKDIDVYKGTPIYTVPEKMQEELKNVNIDPIIPDGYFQNTQEYQQKSLEVLQSINENTANLYILVELINQGNDKQDELISLMTEVLSLAKAKSKEEVDTLFKKIMSKITDTADCADSMIKIGGWATTVYHMVLNLLP